MGKHIWLEAVLCHNMANGSTEWKHVLEIPPGERRSRRERRLLLYNNLIS